MNVDDCKHDTETLRYTKHCRKCGIASDIQGPHPDTEALKRACELLAEYSKTKCPLETTRRYNYNIKKPEWCDHNRKNRIEGSTYCHDNYPYPFYCSFTPVECWMKKFRVEK